MEYLCNHATEISVVSGIVSIVLAIYAMIQSYKSSKRMDQIMRRIETKIEDTYILERENDASGSVLVSLHKDSIVVIKTSDFKEGCLNNDKTLRELEEAFNKIIKKTSVPYVITFLKDKKQDKLSPVTMRSEVNSNTMVRKQEINEVRKVVNKYGIDIFLIFN